VTDDAGQVIWSARYQPFGEATIHEDPDGDLENYDLNIRFPGQYFDSESGLHYNYFRDYEPSVGRYIESDPIGLLGGTNTYLYARGNPLIWIDPTGRESKIACQIRCSLTKRILICPPFVVAGAGLGAGLGAAVGGLGTGPAAIAGAVIGQRVGASLGARAGGVVCSLLVQTICEKECTPKTCEG
jgi:RHS repeat-associated protein